MSFQILDIALFSSEGRRRVLSLRPGAVNIITGASKSGKSALIEVVDYCLGSGSCGVPEGVIRQTVQWFGLRLQLREGQAFIARRAPARGAARSSEVFYATGTLVEVPESSELRQTTNVEAAVQLLTAAAGIGANIHEPTVGQRRPHLSANLRHALAFVFQPQDEIIRRQHLFHKQSNNWVAQAIKDTLPYFLGAVDEEHVAKREELRRLRQQLRDRERRLATMESVRGQGLGKAAALLSEARDLGLVEFPERPSSWEDAVALLRQAMDSPVEEQVARQELGEAGDEYGRLIAERRDLQLALQRAKADLEGAKALKAEERGYSHEVTEQGARLKSLGILPNPGNKRVCPLCSVALPEDTVPSVRDLESAVVHISHQLERVTRSSPEVQRVIDQLEENVQGLKQRLADNREALEAVRESSERLRAMREASSRRAHVIGRVSLYLESLPEVEDTSELRREIDHLRQQVIALEEDLSDERVQERLESISSILGSTMSEWARDLGLEHSEFPLRLDLRRLNVVADTEDGPLSMEHMGSGENWVGYHLIGHLALHEWFTKRSRPVPRFLFLDQPSQVYFPSEREADGSMEGLPDDDRDAVIRMFRLIFHVVADLSPGFQAIVTEHADIAEDWYQTAIVERWRGGLRLVPEDWYGETGESSRNYAKAVRDANHDALTDLYSYQALVQRVEEELGQANRAGSSLALLFVDLDTFKEINDEYGHPAGNEVLRQVARVVSQCIQSTDIAGRYGGDEFVVLLVDSYPQGAVRVAEQIRQRVSDLRIPVPDGFARTTCSIGIAFHRGAERSLLSTDELFAEADASLNIALAHGGDKVGPLAREELSR